MKQLLCAIMILAMLTVVPASAQQVDEHSQHHSTGDNQTTAPAASTPDASAPAQSPNGNALPTSPEPGGMMQMMMRNMPGECRAAMQGMPQACMSMMNKMMQGGMMQGGSGTVAGSQAEDHSAHGGAATESSSAPASAAPHVAAFGVAIEKMHAPMMDGVRAENPDVAFVRGMIPHHQAAIDMALVALQFGKDEQMRKLALDVIREQSREIAEMNEWLRLNSK
jgi:uncharacterized protein (DUF305 family)